MNQHLSKRKALKEAIPYLERFGLGEYSNKPPYAMSGGMRQRASFVRTILTGKDILLFDEPFGAGAADDFLETERKVFSYVRSRRTGARGGPVFHHADDHGPGG